MGTAPGFSTRSTSLVDVHRAHRDDSSREVTPGSEFTQQAPAVAVGQPNVCEQYIKAIPAAAIECATSVWNRLRPVTKVRQDKCEDLASVEMIFYYQNA